MKNIIEQQDSELLYMIRCGSYEAFQLLSYKYDKIIKKFITSTLQDSYIYGYDIEDIIEECLITFYDVLFCFDENKGTFYPYVMQSVRYRIYDLIKMSMAGKNSGFNYSTSMLHRDSEKSNVLDGNNIEYYAVDDDSFHPKNVFVIKETVTNILGDDSDLDKNERVVAALRIMGYSIEEIAKKINVNKKKIDYIVRNIKKKIKDNSLK